MDPIIYYSFRTRCRSGVRNKTSTMQMPKVVFVPCARSHRFERRVIEVYEEVKVSNNQVSLLY